MLVAAFRATLEEVLEADIVIHVRDASHPDTDMQKQDVEGVLEELGVDIVSEDSHLPLVEALNKSDQLSDEDKHILENKQARAQHQVILSGLTGEGCDSLLETIDEMLGATDLIKHVDLEFCEGAAMAYLKAKAEILEETVKDDKMHFEVKIDPLHWDRFLSRFPKYAPEKPKKEEWE